MTIENGAARAHATPWTVESAEELYAVRAGATDSISSTRRATRRCARCSTTICRSTSSKSCRLRRPRCRSADAGALSGRAARPSAPVGRSVRRRDRRGGLRQPLSGDLSDQGEPAARSRRGSARRGQGVRHGSRMRLEDGADRGAAAHRRRPAAVVQRREGPRHAVVDPVGAAARPARAADHREVHRVRTADDARATGRIRCRVWRAREARDARRRALVRVGRRAFEVRPDRAGAGAAGARTRAARHAGPAGAAAFPPRQPDHRHPGAEARDQGSDAGLCRSASARRARCVASTSAAASACTTAAATAWTSRRSTTACRNTRTPWCSRCRKSARRARCPSR